MEICFFVIQSITNSHFFSTLNYNSKASRCHVIGFVLPLTGVDQIQLDIRTTNIIEVHIVTRDLLLPD